MVRNILQDITLDKAKAQNQKLEERNAEVNTKLNKIISGLEWDIQELQTQWTEEKKTGTRAMADHLGGELDASKRMLGSLKALLPEWKNMQQVVTVTKRLQANEASRAAAMEDDTCAGEPEYLRLRKEEIKDEKLLKTLLERM